MKTHINNMLRITCTFIVACALLSACGGSSKAGSNSGGNGTDGVAGSESAGTTTTTTDDAGNEVATTVNEDGTTTVVTTDTEGNETTVVTDSFGNTINEDGSFTTPEGTTVEIGEEGLCANESDSAIATENFDAIEASINTLMSEQSACAIEAGGVDGDCAADSLVADFAISEDCGSCFATMITCLGAEGADETACDSAFTECSGISIEFGSDHGEGDEGAGGGEEAPAEEGEEEEGGEEGGEDGGEAGGTVTFKDAATCAADGDDCECSLVTGDVTKITNTTLGTIWDSVEAAAMAGDDVSDELESDPGLSIDCAGCFETSAGCFMTAMGGACAADCADPDSAACDTCLDTACEADFVSCSGVVES